MPNMQIDQQVLHIHEKCFGFQYDLKSLSDNGLIETIRTIGLYTIARSLERGMKMEDYLVHASFTRRDGDKEFMVIPKSSCDQLLKVCHCHGVAAIIHPASPPYPSNTGTGIPFKNGLVPNHEQQTVLDTICQRPQSGIIEYAMAGGKSLLIAGIIRAWSQLNPILVLSSGTTETVQLATELMNMLGEPVAVLGCAKQRKLFAKTGEARIYVGTHALLRQIPAVLYNDSEADLPLFSEQKNKIGGADPKPELLRIVQSAQAIIADEVDVLSTWNGVSRLVGLQPQLFIGLTGTFGRRKDRTDRLLGDYIHSKGWNDTIARVNHSRISQTGRVSPVEVFGYHFDCTHYPKPMRPAMPWENLIDYHVNHHPGRNRFVAELLVHLLEVQTREKRKAVICFAKSIEHGAEILRLLKQVLGVPRGHNPIGIIQHHAQLSAEKIQSHLSAIKTGQVRLVITTDTLGRGFDTAELSDVVDCAGQKESRNTLQRAGRTIRYASGKSARIHIILDSSHEALVQISNAKLRNIEDYFAVTGKVYSANRLPWKLTEQVVFN